MFNRFFIALFQKLVFVTYYFKLRAKLYLKLIDIYKKNNLR